MTELSKNLLSFVRKIVDYEFYAACTGLWHESYFHLAGPNPARAVANLWVAFANLFPTILSDGCRLPDVAN